MPMSLLGAIFALVGVPFVWLAWRAFARNRGISRWPRAPGVVLGSYVHSEKSKYRHDDGHYYDYTAYRPHVRYAYTVEGKALEGESIARSIDGFTMDERAARALVDKYPAQRQVQVLYDPNDPQKAHLEVKRSVGAWILLAFGCLWLGIGGLLMMLSIFA